MQLTNYRNKMVIFTIFTLIYTLIYLIFCFSTIVYTSTGTTNKHIHPGSYRLVMQIIDYQFYKWYEYSNPDSGYYSIYLIEPVKKALTADETATFLRASREWETQYLIFESTSLAGTPALTDYSEVDKKAELLPDQIKITAIQMPQREGLVDNRTAIDGNNAVEYPYYTVGFLTINFLSENMRGTGFLVGPHTVLTNAHNVYASNFGGWFQSIYFSPGQYEDEWLNEIKPYSTASPINAETNQKYLDYENDGDRDNFIKYDYAALFFEDAFSGIDTFMPLEFDYNPTMVSLLGYPGVVRDSESFGMWRSDGAVVSQDAHCLYYKAYTSGGSSGSPVFVYNAQADTYRVVAIHSFILEGSSNYSGGPHLNENNRQIFEEWLRWVPTGNGEDSDTDKLILGDINGDRKINVLDAVLVLQHILQLDELTDGNALDMADVNRDNNINVIDVTMIMQYSLGKLDSF